MNIRGPVTGVQPQCERVLRTLPRWFGIEESLVEYAENTNRLPTFVAEHDGQVVAFLSVESTSSVAWEINCIAVDAEHRGEGFGKVLLLAAEAWLILQSARLLQVKTLSAAHPSPEYAETREFYDSMGFLPLEEFPLLWGEHLPVLLLVRMLPSAG